MTTNEHHAPDPSPAPSIDDELDVLIRARYPIIYVVSWEEARVEQHLLRIAGRHNKELHGWSITRGMQKIVRFLVDHIASG